MLRSGIRDLTVVPLDATHEALVSEDDCDRLAALGTPAGTAAAAIIRTRIDGYEAIQPQAIHNSAPVHDAVCVAHLIEPDVIETREAHVDVELNGELTRGRTVVDLRPIPAHAAEREVGVRGRPRPFPRAAPRGVSLDLLERRVLEHQPPLGAVLEAHRDDAVGLDPGHDPGAERVVAHRVAGGERRQLDLRRDELALRRARRSSTTRSAAAARARPLRPGSSSRKRDGRFASVRP